MSPIILTASIQNIAAALAPYLPKSPHDSNLLFITTTAEPQTEWGLDWLDRDRQSLIDAGFTVTDYTITHQTHEQIATRLEATDIICFSGGNAFYLLWQIQQTNSLDLIVTAVKQGKTYLGSSSGSIIAGPLIEPARTVVPHDPAWHLRDYRGLSLVDYTIIPHWGSADPDWQEIFLQQNSLQHAYSPDHKLILLADNQFIINQDNWYQIIDTQAKSPNT